MGNAERTPIPPKPASAKRGKKRANTAPASAKSLAELQDRFQRALLEGDDGFLEDIKDSSREDREVLLGVYRYAYKARLIEFLLNDYEKLGLYLGDEQFEEMARAYIDANPSHNPNGRWFGTKLPGFLSTTPPYSDHPVLAGLARLECALNDVFDAADSPAIGVADVAALPPENWQNLTFTPHPATRRITLTTNAAAIWSALHNDEEPPQIKTGADSHILVYRHDFTAMFRPMAYDEAMMWDEAANGVPFGVLCEMLAAYAGEDEAPMRAAGYLRGWLEAGALARLGEAR